MKVQELSHEDEIHWGDGAEERDPQPGPTLYFTVWGFALLFASIFFLQALTYSHQLWETNRKGTSAGGALQQMRSEQEAQLKRGSPDGKPISQAMSDVIKKYGKGSK